MRTFLSLFFGLIIAQGYAQLRGYSYSQEILDASNNWHKIELPNSMFQHLNSRQSDIRILGITPDNDTIETPYLIEEYKHNSSVVEFPFEQLNSSRKDDTYYSAFKLNKLVAINQIELRLSNQNFDYRVKLEGSSDNNEWFTILNDYRILGLNTSSERLSFKKLLFSKSLYQYSRVSILTSEHPKIEGASINFYDNSEVKMSTYTYEKINEVTNEDNETIFQIELYEAVPVSYINIQTNHNQDFARRLEVEALLDIFETEKGMRYSYSTIHNGLFSSLQSNKYNFNPTLAKIFRIKIINNDNTPIPIADIKLKGFKSTLTTRLDSSAKYFLVYGNSKATSPNYDLVLFKDKLPSDISFTKLGETKSYIAEEVPSPAKSSKWILWIIIPA
ncbi:hypothetical protein N9I68_01920 [Bacteroidia bacterium]|nr:hypothetical protein [Bacteroidia bacterium]